MWVSISITEHKCISISLDCRVWRSLLIEMRTYGRRRWFEKEESKQKVSRSVRGRKIKMISFWWWCLTYGWFTNHDSISYSSMKSWLEFPEEGSAPDTKPLSKIPRNLSPRNKETTQQSTAKYGDDVYQLFYMYLLPVTDHDTLHVCFACCSNTFLRCWGWLVLWEWLLLLLVHFIGNRLMPSVVDIFLAVLSHLSDSRSSCCIESIVISIVPCFTVIHFPLKRYDI
jgi:hypothetical protein